MANMDITEGTEIVAVSRETVLKVMVLYENKGKLSSSKQIFRNNAEAL